MYIITPIKINVQGRSTTFNCMCIFNFLKRKSYFFSLFWLICVQFCSFNCVHLEFITLGQWSVIKNMKSTWIKGKNWSQIKCGNKNDFLFSKIKIPYTLNVVDLPETFILIGVLIYIFCNLMFITETSSEKLIFQRNVLSELSP